MEENRQYNNPPRRGGHGAGRPVERSKDFKGTWIKICLLYTSDAADD